MLVVHVHVRVRPGQVEEFLAATLTNARASLAEPGVLRFDVIQDEADTAHVVLVEVYRDASAYRYADGKPRAAKRDPDTGATTYSGHWKFSDANAAKHVAFLLGAGMVKTS